MSERDDLRDMVRDLLKARASSEAARAVARTEEGFDPDLYWTVAGLGLTGLLVPESLGGSGGELADVAVVLHELGRLAVPLPFVQSAVLAPTALLAASGAADGAAAGTLLADLVAGERRAAVVLGGPDGTLDPGTWSLTFADGRLGGCAGFVLDAPSADELIVVAASADGPVLLLVPASAATVTGMETEDLTRRLGEVVFEGTGVADDQVLSTGADAAAIAQGLVRTAAWAIACDATGLAQRTTELTAEYARERHQFGRPIGSFQAIKHACADMSVTVECGRAALDSATRKLSGVDPEAADLAASIAKSAAGDGAVEVCGAAMQVHGGIGFTWEHDAHIWLKRALLDRALFGSSSWHRRRVADAVLPPAALAG